MTNRLDREDLTRQQDNLTAARSELLVALQAVQYQADQAARALTSKAKRPPAVDLTAYLAAHVAVTRAEESYDHATRDLASAAGEHT